MTRLILEIVIGIIIFIIGTVMGVLITCICRASGEAEKRLESGKNERD